MKIPLLFMVAFLSSGCQPALEKPIQPVMQVQEDAPEVKSTQAPTEMPIPIEETEMQPEEPAATESIEKPMETPIETPEPTPEPTPTEPTPTESTAQNLTTTDYTGLANETYGWYFNRNSEHMPPTAQRNIDLQEYDAYYLGDTEQKTVYLTFDEGYENGYTGKILDILKEKNVSAAFFLTKPYIKSETDLVKRMIEEGHVAGNHSVTHPSMPDLSTDEILSELQETARYFEEITGAQMPNFFRPPMGEYSQRTLAITKDAGYKTIFWSFAYQDWLVAEQPGKAVAYKTVMDNLHNGSIILLHAVSQSNTEALPEIIDAVREQGYTFSSLHDLPER